MKTFGYNSGTLAAPYWAERPPRNQSRTDLPELNLFDGGHGPQTITKNPVLCGLGVTIRLALNQFAQSFRVFIQDVGVGVDIEITNQLTRVADQRVYELRGRAGFGVLNPGGRPPSDFETTRTLKITVVSTNVTISSKVEYLLYIGYEKDVRTCAEPRMADFPLLQCLRENFLQLWLDKIKPARQPWDTDKENLYFFFDQSDALAQLAPCICDCFNWNGVVTSGFKFYLVGEDEDEAGCHPWPGPPIPDGFGGDCILPPNWQDFGCP